MSDYGFKGSDGQVYRLSAMTFKDRTDLQAYVQFREYHEFRELKDTFPPEDYKEHAAALMLQCSKKTALQIETETDDFIETAVGSCYMVYISLRRMHPDLTFKHVRSIITLDNLPDIAAILNQLNPHPSNDNKKKADEPSQSLGT